MNRKRDVNERAQREIDFVGSGGSLCVAMQGSLLDLARNNACRRELRTRQTKVEFCGRSIRFVYAGNGCYYPMMKHRDTSMLC